VRDQAERLLRVHEPITAQLHELQTAVDALIDALAR
jgi:hypothetical protein